MTHCTSELLPWCGQQENFSISPCIINDSVDKLWGKHEIAVGELKGGSIKFCNQ